MWETRVQSLGSVGKIPWRRKWQPTPVFLPGKSHGQRNLPGYNPWGHKSQTQLSELNPNQPVDQMLKNLPAMREAWVLSLGWEDPLEKGVATHSSIVAWKIP